MQAFAQTELASAIVSEPRFASLRHYDHGFDFPAMIVVPEGCEARLTDYRGREISLGEGLHEITMKDNK